MSSEKPKDPRVTERLPEREERITERLPQEGSERVTERLPGSGEGRVTERLPEAPEGGGVTERLPDEEGREIPFKVIPAEAPRTGLLKSAEIVDGRYEVEEGPLADKTGEAELYRCLDHQTRETVALKYYRAEVTPKNEVLKSLVNLEHPNLVALRGYGQWGGHFYEVQEFCEGGGVTDLLPLSEADLKSWLGQMVSGLKFCHDHGIVHRDVKPGNLLFRDRERTQLVIGDFGISSFLAEEEGRQITRTYMFFTMDYASPEQLRLRQVSAATDYYSLGITLIHLFLGHTPFADLAYHEVVDAHLQGNVPIPEGLSDRFQTLLKGLLHKNADYRWGYDQVMAWLRDEPILEKVYFDKEMPYPACPEAGNPHQLARCLDDFDAKDELFRGRLTMWAGFFNSDLAAEIAAIEKEYEDQPDLGVFKLKYTLNSDLPLSIEETDISDMLQLVEALTSEDRILQAGLRKAFWDGRIDTWIETAFRGPRGLELAEKVRDFRERHAGREWMGALPLLFMIDPARPLDLGPGLAVASPEEMIAALVKNPEAKSVIHKLLRTGQLEAWLEIAFPERADDLAHVAHYAALAEKQPDLALMAVIWRFRPKTSLTYGDWKVKTPKELAALIDQEPNGWKKGLELLERGWLRAWLVSTGRLRDPRPLDELMANQQLTSDATLEAVLHLLDPDLPHPEAVVDRKEVRLGHIAPGDTRTVELVFTNQGRGRLSGRLFAEGGANELMVVPQVLQGDSTLVKVICQPPDWLKSDISRQILLVADTNGGKIEIPFTYRITKEEETEGEGGALSRLIKSVKKLVGN